MLPDDEQQISQRLTELIDHEYVELIFTTGGTGLGPRDVTPEATQSAIDREVPAIAEAMRSYGKQRTPYAMLSRAVVSVRKNSLVVNLPGSSRGVEECLQVLFPGLLHAFHMLWARDMAVIIRTIEAGDMISIEMLRFEQKIKEPR